MPHFYHKPKNEIEFRTPERPKDFCGNNPFGYGANEEAFPKVSPMPPNLPGGARLLPNLHTDRMDDLLLKKRSNFLNIESLE